MSTTTRPRHRLQAFLIVMLLAMTGCSGGQYLGAVSEALGERSLNERSSEGLVGVRNLANSSLLSPGETSCWVESFIFALGADDLKAAGITVERALDRDDTLSELDALLVTRFKDAATTRTFARAVFQRFFEGCIDPVELGVRRVRQLGTGVNSEMTACLKQNREFKNALAEGFTVNLVIDLAGSSVPQQEWDALRADSEKFSEAVEDGLEACATR